MFLGKQRFQSDEGEKIIKIIHRHWFNILKHLFLVFVMMIVISISFLYLSSVFPQELQNRDVYTFSLFLENTFMLFMWLYLFFIWIDYYFDIWIITDKRIVNIEQKGLFIRSMSELQYEKIQDVTTEVDGILPTVMNFGDVSIQTAGTEEHFLFRQVPDPYGIKNLIMNLQKNQETKETDKLGEMIKERLEGE